MNIIYNKEFLSKPTIPFSEEELLCISQNREIQNLFNQMIETMKEYKGDGLAANQVGENRSVCIIRYKPLNLVLLNPVIIYESHQKIIKKNEGCLSVPDERYNTLRHRKIIVVARTRWGGRVKYKEISGNFSWVLQHEIDHLNGKLFLERVIKEREI